MKEIKRRTLVMASLADLPSMTTEWLWPGRIALDHLTLLVGEEGAGKTQVALDIAARVSRGAEWPDGEANAGAGKVLLLSAGDHAYRMIKPAFEAAQGDLQRIDFPYQTQEEYLTGKKRKRPINFKRDLDLLCYSLNERPECKLVIIDPLLAFLGFGKRAEDDDVLTVLRKLERIAIQYHVALLAVTSLRATSGWVIQRVVGGMPLTMMSRAIWMVGREPAVGGRKSEVRGQKSEIGGEKDNGAGESSHGERVESREEKRESRREGRLLLPVKNNLTGEGAGLGFAPEYAEGALTPRVEWRAGKVNMAADEVLPELPKRHGRAPVAHDKAVEFVREMLAHGPRLVKEVARAARERGISAGTLRRGRSALELNSFRTQIPGPWSISLKNGTATSEKCEKHIAPVALVAPVAKNTKNSSVFRELVE